MSKKQISTAVPAKKRHTVRNIIIAAVSVILCAAILWLGISCIGVNKLLNPERAALVHNDGPVELDMVYEYFQITDYNGEDTLTGWWIPHQDPYGEIIGSSKTVIFSHNYEATREMLPVSGLFIARYLVYAGYNVVMFDYSGSGRAAGKNYTFGAQEAEELSLVVDYVSEEREQESIAVMGWAFGAAAAIIAGCDNDKVDVIIADSSYKNLKAYMESNVDVWTKLPSFLFNPIINALLPIFADYPIWNASPIDSVTEATGKNILFIHCINDYVFPYGDSSDMYNAALESGNNAEIKLFEDSLHIYGFMDWEDEYMETVIAFLEKYMS